MAKIVKRRLKWDAVSAADLTGYKVYFQTDGAPIDYATSPSVGFGPSVLVAVIPDDLPDLAGVEGSVTLGVTAVDDAGNESDVSSVTVDIDVTPPAAPGGVVVEAFF